MGAALKAAYGDRLVLDYADNPADPTSARVLDPKGFERRKRDVPDGILAIHGHFHPAKYRITDDCVLFTHLREPVANIISIYYYWQQMPHQSDALHRYVVQNKLSLIEMAQLPLIRRLYSQTYFGDFDMGRFDIVGRHEARDSMLGLLDQRLSVGLDPTVFVNVTPHDERRLQIEHDAQLRSHLRDLLRDDIEFYERWARP